VPRLVQRHELIEACPRLGGRVEAFLVEEALRGYRRLLSLALRLLEDQGVLVMCCCSGLITAVIFGMAGALNRMR